VLYMLGSQAKIEFGIFWATISVVLQVMALTFFSIQRNK